MNALIEVETPDQPGVLHLLRQSDAYMAELYPAESNHLVDVTDLLRPEVTFFVARRDGDIVGCCALVNAGGGNAEIKRMFVDPAARGLKLGGRLLAALESHALRSGVHTIQLETGIHQPEAIGLYRRSGFAERGPFGAYRQDPLSIFMEKRLTSTL
ncbi:GNAT family N-acetyltransferase [Rhizobium sp. CFBP 8762]|uniref:GNAT family N-acetyltransferase n=1 Tax=Rhizobium sp. CFBP 8762 TaxID=2775279 RepID=UPI00177D59AF|nr:GNAT family N-acetyltransferase [Rhizobium sp. CFBP 8762]MBD8555688.1 GNAT family N-acetyltransferase [Rhizobium sp. CFBP 8762]